MYRLYRIKYAENANDGRIVTVVCGVLKWKIDKYNAIEYSVPVIYACGKVVLEHFPKENAKDKDTIIIIILFNNFEY